MVVEEEVEGCLRIAPCKLNVHLPNLYSIELYRVVNLVIVHWSAVEIVVGVVVGKIVVCRVLQQRVDASQQARQIISASEVPRDWSGSTPIRVLPSIRIILCYLS